MRRSERRRAGTWALLGSALLVAALPAPDPESLMASNPGAGSATEVSCGSGWALVGVKGRAGSWLNNLFLVCQQVQGGTLGQVKSLEYTYQRIGGLAGLGTGPYGVKCPSGMVVKGIMVYRGSYIHRIGLYCRTWTSAGTTTGHLYGPAGGSGGTFDARTCSDRTHVVTALHAREGTYIDGLGIRCRTP